MVLQGIRERHLQCLRAGHRVLLRDLYRNQRECQRLETYVHVKHADALDPVHDQLWQHNHHRYDHQSAAVLWRNDIVLRRKLLCRRSDRERERGDIHSNDPEPRTACPDGQRNRPGERRLPVPTATGPRDPSNSDVAELPVTISEPKRHGRRADLARPRVV